MKPIVIIEGLDRCGKSTLVNQLATHLGPGTVKHHSGPPPKIVYPDNLKWEVDNYRLLMHTFRKVSEIHSVVVDRFHLGCPVFGKRYRNYPIDFHVTNVEYQMSIPRNTYLILLTDYPKAILSRDDGLSFEKTEEDFLKTKTEFEKEFEMSEIKNKLNLNITDNGGFANTLPTVLKFIESQL